MRKLRVKLALAARTILGYISPELLAKHLFKDAFGRKLDLNNPQTFNEKVNFLKVKSDTREWTRLADKYAVREHLENLGLGDYLVKLYGKWDRVEDIDFDILPNKFVLKANNSCGTVLIVNDKSKLDIEQTKKLLNKWLKMLFGYNSAEPHYSAIKSCIIAEELLESEDGRSLTDYKWFCFDGDTKYAQIVYDRQGTTHTYKLNVYDSQWNVHPEFVRPVPKNFENLPKPNKLGEMLNICSILSKGFPQVRVDLYEVNGKIYFGELTFTNAAGYDTEFSESFDKLLGSYIKL